MKKYILIVLSVVLLVGCQSEPPQAPSMVIEAWIDANGYPTVLIHKSYVFATAGDTTQRLEDIIKQQLIPFGKVTLTDGEQTEVLTGRLDTTYMPPFLYSTTRMKGEVGKAYTVTAQWEDLYASARTTIPPVARLDSVVVRGDSAGFVDARGYMTIDTQSEAYYALFMRDMRSKQYQFCPWGVFESKDAQQGQMEMRIYNPFNDTINNPKQTLYFWRDTVPDKTMDYYLKVARIDYPSYQFWKAYNERIVLKGIIFVPVYKNIASNVEGGLGYFCGMGSSSYPIRLDRDTVYHLVQ